MSLPSLLNISNYSFSKSTLTVEDIISYAVENHHTHVVISEYENLHSCFKFHKLARENNLIPIIGMKVSYDNASVLLLAKNYAGYKNLINISQNKQLLSFYLDNLIFIHIEGEDQIDHDDKYLANVDAANGVYIRENTFLNKEDYEFNCLLKAINNNSSLFQEKNLNSFLHNNYLTYIPDISESSVQIQNIYSILSQCEYYDLITNEYFLDFFDNPELLLRQNLDELFKKFNFCDDVNYKFRLDLEYEILVSQKFCSYFLIVYDAVKWAKEHGICVGPGRGSVCGSLIAYVLGITEIDPIKYGLLFERFLNPTRISFPDIDIDVANDRREELIEYLQSKYGIENVALISVYQTFKLKNSFREISEAYEIPKENIDFLSRDLSNSESLDNLSSRLSNFFSDNPEIFLSIKKIFNYPKSLSIHAAGIIISSKPLSDFVPILSGKVLKTQWISEELKELGLVKFDFLALQYLTALNQMKNNIEKNDNKLLDWNSIDYADEKVYETIIKGHNAFIFQFESPKIQKLITQFEPKSILDLSLLSSIHRPGASDQISTLLARKISNNFLDLFNDDFSRILKDTYGILVYQEQLIQIVSLVLNCSFGESDTFRRELSINETQCREKFFKQGILRYSQEELLEIWDLISKFAKYGFNKSHSVAYSTISYRLLWIKTYHPVIFYSELLNFSSSSEHFLEIQDRGFNFSTPKYGKSLYNSFSVHNNIFYFPISKILGLTPEFSELISQISFDKTTARLALESFIQKGISKEDLRLLIRSGFFSELFNKNESEYFWDQNLDNLYESVIYVDSNNNPVFDFKYKFCVVTPEIKQEYIRYKSKILGSDIFKNSIPSSFFVKYKAILPLNKLASSASSENKYIGFLSYAKESKTLKGISFLWVRLSDNFYETPNLIYFGENFEAIKSASLSNMAAIITVHNKDNFYKITKLKILDK